MTQFRDLMRRKPQLGFALPVWFDRLLSVGIVTRDPQLVRRQRCVNVVSYATAVSSASYLVMTSLYDFTSLLPLHAYNMLMVVACTALPRLHRFGANVVA